MNHDPAAAFRQLCSEFSLSNQVVADLQECVEEIRAYEQGDKLTSPTRSDQRRSLARVKDDAERLIASLNALWAPNSTELDHALTEAVERLEDCLQAVLPSTFPYADVVTDVRGVTVQRLQSHLALLVRGADDAAVEAHAESVQEARALLVGGIAVAVRDTSIRPRRGGDFENLCNAVFEAAGVDTSAEGAVRLFVESLLPSYRERRFCS